MSDIFARHHAQERARGEKAEREATDPNSPEKIKARMQAAAEARKPLPPAQPYRPNFSWGHKL
jgi:hypothetical protein